MKNNFGELQPFYVPAKVFKPTATGDTSASGGGAAVPPQQPPRKPQSRFVDPDLGVDLNSSGVKLAAAALFGAAYVLLQTQPALMALTVFILLGAVMLRLDAHRRRIAAVPVTLATLLLACNMAKLCAMPASNQLINVGTLASWLPLFFAACIFYMPRVNAATNKILMTGAMLLLLSGLLPGNGFEVIFVMTQYYIFIAVVIGLAIDLAGNGAHQHAPAASVA
jgi:hypothetical protein